MDESLRIGGGRCKGNCIVKRLIAGLMAFSPFDGKRGLSRATAVGSMRLAAVRAVEYWA